MRKVVRGAVGRKREGQAAGRQAGRRACQQLVGSKGNPFAHTLHEEEVGGRNRAGAGAGASCPASLRDALPEPHTNRTNKHHTTHVHTHTHCAAHTTTHFTTTHKNTHAPNPHTLKPSTPQTLAPPAHPHQPPRPSRQQTRAPCPAAWPAQPQTGRCRPRTPLADPRPPAASGCPSLDEGEAGTQKHKV